MVEPAADFDLRVGIEEPIEAARRGHDTCCRRRDVFGGGLRLGIRQALQAARDGNEALDLGLDVASHLLREYGRSRQSLRVQQLEHQRVDGQAEGLEAGHQPP